MKYSLGLDIGVASVGWAVVDLDKKRIHDLGVRLFEKAEDPQSGDSLAKPRREARSARRRLKRRHQRLNNLKNFFVDNNLLSRRQVQEVLNPASTYNNLDVYALRVKALKDPLTSEELLKVLYQLAKRRGFKSNRKVQDETDEGGRVTKALKTNEQLLANKGYRTVGEALASDSEYADHRRNKRDDYKNSFARGDFEKELQQIITVQRQYILRDIADTKLGELLYGMSDGKVVNKSAILYQRPFITEELIKSMVGGCTFEPSEKRAPRASYSFELFKLASDLAHLEYIYRGEKKRNGDSLRLTPQQIEKVLAEAKNSKELTYQKVRVIAGIGDEYTAAYFRGKNAEDDEYGEKNIFGGLKAYYNIRTALKGLPDDWTVADNEDTLNQIAYILTTQKSDEGILRELTKLPISSDAMQAALRIKPTNFKTFGHLSIKALKNITPHIIAGHTYDKACELAGYDFRKKALDLEQITNPVVKRAVSQTLKVIKAVERKYGKPYYIRVETARELAKNFKDRKAIEQESKENQVNNTKRVERIQELGITSPTGMQIIKFKLYEEQDCQSLYSGTLIDLTTLLHDDNAYQVDHIIPFSRSSNDSLANKALVTTAENQEKANRTPHEWFGGNESRWTEFTSRVELLYKTRAIDGTSTEKHDNYKFNGYAFKKKNNLLAKDYKRSGWAESPRALNDTRYITKFVQNYLRASVNFAKGDRDSEQRVFAPNGTLTAYMRKRWGLTKDRSEDVLHHAKDAAVVAVMDQSMIYRANQYSKSTEMRQYLSAVKTIEAKAQILLELTNKEAGEIADGQSFEDIQMQKTDIERKKLIMEVLSDKHFPKPWARFPEEVDWRTRAIFTHELRDKMQSFASYDSDFISNIQPIFVSRMPNRKASGGAHDATLRSPKLDDVDKRSVYIPLAKITQKNLAPLENKDPQLYASLTARLENHAWSAQKAFAEPIHKLDKHGNNAHEVRRIKIVETKPVTSGVLINKDRAFADNKSMVRLDLYSKLDKKGRNKFYFVPVYTHHIPHEKKGAKTTKILPEFEGYSDIDDTFTKVSSLFTNDFVRVYFGNKIDEGYYKSYDTNTGRIEYIPHLAADSTKSKLRLSPHSATTIERYDISILGNNLPRL